MLRQSILFSLFLALLPLLVGCAARRPRRTLVLSYGDFAPQVIAHELIGMAWFQWNATGGPDPSQRDDVRVVIHRDLPLCRVKARFPVIRGKSDYRYVAYDKALRFLRAKILELGSEPASENGFPVGRDLCKRYRRTLTRIENSLGSRRRVKKGQAP